mmetsp:Transcript_29148/g.82180  ORF Transcript_29148/g.82180 Transcript_29148/m.82180 type:complete len:260 (+) Transcript_29148:1689-2468(+)
MFQGGRRVLAIELPAGLSAARRFPAEVTDEGRVPAAGGLERRRPLRAAAGPSRPGAVAAGWRLICEAIAVAPPHNLQAVVQPESAAQLPRGRSSSSAGPAAQRLHDCYQPAELFRQGTEKPRLRQLADGQQQVWQTASAGLADLGLDALPRSMAPVPHHLRLHKPRFQGIAGDGILIVANLVEVINNHVSHPVLQSDIEEGVEPLDIVQFVGRNCEYAHQPSELALVIEQRQASLLAVCLCQKVPHLCAGKLLQGGSHG